ncbi:MAG: DegT/DnrJ/EryC1/StrS family aminotransferase [Caldilineae bacterium]|nr:MAG: DegT/DnrJ/EryC1/StrS family aminotransferase [Caldilineae bacterium]
MNPIPLVDLKAQYRAIKPEMDAAIQRVLDTANFILGEEVAAFETAFAGYVHAGGAVGVASGTAALHLALLACGIGPGDEVITTAHTFFATAEAISVTGARPVFVDVDPQTYLLDPNRVEEAITPRTRALLPVHLYGQAADMDALLDIARRHDLWVIEDAAQAHGAMYRGRHCGSIGHLACFSFYPGKNLGCYGDGGIVTGNDARLLDKIRRLRNHGRAQKYEHEEIGWGYRLDALQAAVLRVKLNHLEAWTEARRERAARYTALLRGLEVVTPVEADGNRHVYHLYVIRTPRRDAVLSHLRANGIGAGVHYPIPLHRQPAYRSHYADLRLPITEKVAAEVLSLPLYPELTEAQQVHVVETLKEAMA